jgi:ribosomal-protein-alanine N-acetyltransferase
MQIIPFIADDISQIAVFNTALETPHWTDEKLQACLSHADYLAWQLTLNEQLVAYVLLNVAGDEAHVMHLAVHPAERQQGYGAILLKYTLKQLMQLKKGSVILEVNENNQAAIALYKKCGFQQVGIRKNYYQIAGRGADALVYSYLRR